MSHHEPATQRRRRRFECQQVIESTPQAIFPLLCPVREYDWIPEWDCKVIYTESGVAEPGCVFQTDREADGGLDTWVISRHEPDRRIEFVRTNPLRVIQYDIRLEPLGDHETRLVWAQLITALNEQGDRLVGSLWEEDFVQAVAKLEELMNAYLASHG